MMSHRIHRAGISKYVMAGILLVRLSVSAPYVMADYVLFAQTASQRPFEVASYSDGMNGAQNRFVVFDDFTIPMDAEVTSVNWTGGFIGYHEGASVSRFTICFYESLANQPGVLLSSSVIEGNANEQYFWFIQKNTYSAHLSNPFPVSMHQSYWISIVATVENTSNLNSTAIWGWGITRTSISPSPPYDPVIAYYSNNNGPRYPMTADMSFTLSGIAVPEPPGLCALGIGLICIFLGSCRK